MCECYEEIKKEQERFEKEKKEKKRDLRRHRETAEQPRNK